MLIIFKNDTKNTDHWTTNPSQETCQSRHPTPHPWRVFPPYHALQPHNITEAVKDRGGWGGKEAGPPALKVSHDNGGWRTGNKDELAAVLVVLVGGRVMGTGRQQL